MGCAARDVCGDRDPSNPQLSSLDTADCRLVGRWKTFWLLIRADELWRIVKSPSSGGKISQIEGNWLDLCMSKIGRPD